MFFSYFCKIFLKKWTIKLNENCSSNDWYFLQTQILPSNNRFAGLVFSYWFVASHVLYERFYRIYAELNTLFSSSVMISVSLWRIFNGVPPVPSCFLFFKYVHNLLGLFMISPLIISSKYTSCAFYTSFWLSLLMFTFIHMLWFL